LITQKKEFFDVRQLQKNNSFTGRLLNDGRTRLDGQAGHALRAIPAPPKIACIVMISTRSLKQRRKTKFDSKWHKKIDCKRLCFRPSLTFEHNSINFTSGEMENMQDVAWTQANLCRTQV